MLDPTRDADPHRCRLDQRRSSPTRLATIKTVPRPGRPRAPGRAARAGRATAITGDRARMSSAASAEYHEFAPRARCAADRSHRRRVRGTRRTVTSPCSANESNRALLVSTPCERGLRPRCSPRRRRCRTRRSARPTTPRSGSPLPGTPISRSCSPKACTATGSEQGSPRSPTAGRRARAARPGRDRCSRGRAPRRLGPPDRPDRELPPARSLYVDAMADTLEHTQDRRARALAPLGEWARNRHQGRCRPPARRGSRCRHRGGRGAWACSEAEIVTLWQPPVDDDEVLALGRAATRVTDERT